MLSYIGFGEFDGAAILLRHFNDGAQRNLRRRKGGREADRDTGNDPRQVLLGLFPFFTCMSPVKA